MVSVDLTDKQMTVTLMGLHKIWAVKSKLDIPLEQVAGARIDPGQAHRPAGYPWRAPGTYVPFLITAGTYRGHGEKVFWDVVHKDKAIVIDLKDAPYKQLVVEVQDPQHVVDSINERLD